MSCNQNISPEACYTFEYALPMGNISVESVHEKTFTAGQTPLSSNPIVYEMPGGVITPLVVGTVVGTRKNAEGCASLPPKMVGQCLLPLSNGKIPSVHECVTSTAFSDVTKTYERKN